MAVIAVPYEPVILARWAFRAPLERLAAEADERDRYAVREALAVDGLHFDLLDTDQATRLAQRLAKVADDLRASTCSLPQAATHATSAKPRSPPSSRCASMTCTSSRRPADQPRSSDAQKPEDRALARPGRRAAAFQPVAQAG